MNIKDSMAHSFGGFKLDVDKIGNVSTNERKIKLPYTGGLPESYDTATIFLRVTPESVRIVLEAKADRRKPTKYIVEASRDEINIILLPLFWFKAAENKYHTRMDNGLSAYWNGHYQAEFMAWHSIGQQPVRIASIIQQLPKEQRAYLYRMIDQIKREEAVAG